MIITAKEFVKKYCESAGWTEKEFYASQVPMPDDSSPSGWSAISNNPLSIKAHVDLYCGSIPNASTRLSHSIDMFGSLSVRGNNGAIYIGMDSFLTSPGSVPDTSSLYPKYLLQAIINTLQVKADELPEEPWSKMPSGRDFHVNHNCHLTDGVK
ncbi:hypothetical protein [Buttiauxella gaviniae]|uniref:hypothetical protein n=1 Tax=Buttiauxella gaviniae TaxID=82990 RepID=UPI00397685D2